MSGEPIAGTRDHLLNLVHRAVTHQIRLADQAEALASTIGKHAEAINATGFGHLFGPLQVILADELVLRVTKLFDPTRRYPTLGIQHVLDYLEEHADVLTVDGRAAVETSIRRGDPGSSESAHLTAAALTRAFVAHCRIQLPRADSNSSDPLSAALGALRFRRDKEIAHNESVEPSSRIRAGWHHCQLLLAWAKEFLRIVGEGYMGFYFATDDGTFMLTKRTEEISILLEQVLERAEIIQL